MNQEERNLSQIGDFKNKNYECFASLANGDWSTTAVIAYESNGLVVKETLKVFLYKAGLDAGKISLDEGRRIQSIDYHMDFLPRYGSFKCSAEGFLVIENRSAKMGQYKVTIVPC